MTPPKHNSPTPDIPAIENDEDAAWDALFESTADQLRAAGEEARAAYEAGQTVEMDFEDEYLGLGNDPENL